MSHSLCQDKTDPVIIWQLSDGKRGHLSQSTGLVNALCRQLSAEVHIVETPPLHVSLCSYLTGSAGWARYLPRPRVVVGAGHATHIPMLAISRAYRIKTVVLMRPSLPLSWFDYCLIPAHDNPPARDNVIVTQGAVNPLQPGPTHDPRRGLILIGGDSAHYEFEAGAVLCCIREIMRRATGCRWTVSNSPRTPAALCTEISRLEAADVVMWDRCEQDWLATELQRVAEVWVTEDSVSMIYEALTAGCRVGVLPVQRKAKSRLHRAVDQLSRERAVSSFADWLQGGRLNGPHKPPDEANRCARLLLDQGLLEAKSRYQLSVNSE